MTEYSNVINCSRTLRNIVVVRNKKSLELMAKRIKLTVKQTIENIRKNDRTNAYIRALSKQKDHLQKYIFMRLLKLPISPSIELYQPASMKKVITRALTIDIKTCY